LLLVYIDCVWNFDFSRVIGLSISR